MYHDVDEYPYDYEDLPDVAALIDEVEWDALCVFDACRWDAFTEVTGRDAEPVCSPGSNTPKWTSRVWCNDDYDWSDVTYISANAHTTAARFGTEQGKDWSGKIEEHVGEYVEAFRREDVWGKDDDAAKPEPVTELAFDYEPPIVLHYLQPHEPFIGDTKCVLNLGLKEDRDEYAKAVDKRFENYPDVTFEGNTFESRSIYYAVIKGLVSPSMIRLAYLDNVARVWKASKDIRQQFGTVITTADHAERLGNPLSGQQEPGEHDPSGDTVEVPYVWGHDEESPQGRVIPFHVNRNDLELPDPQSVGAANSHKWTLE